MILSSATVQELDRLEHETPFAITDSKIALKKYHDLLNIAPFLDVFYAIKSNPTDDIITELHAAGSGFEVASWGEFNLLTSKHGVDAQKILYSNPVKPRSHITETYAHGLRMYAADSESEIKKIARYAPGSSVYIRVHVPDASSSFPLSNRFGCDAEEAVELLLLAKRIGLSADGITFHVGSQATNAAAWADAFDICTHIMQSLLLHGTKLEFINVGGGLPANYGQDATDGELSTIVENIRGSLDKLPYQVKIFAEPGRYISAESTIIASEVIARKTRNNENWLHLDIGIFQGLMESFQLSNWLYPMMTSKDATKHKKATYTLTGPTCDPYDIITTQGELPDNLQEGDRLYFLSAGAYSLCYGSSFNGFLTPAIHSYRFGEGTNE